MRTSVPTSSMKRTTAGLPFTTSSSASRITRNGEYMIKSTLKMVSKYDEDTKLGLKVFHLQRISESQSRDADLSSDERYRNLKSSLFIRENFKQLSTAQAVAVCVALGRLEGKNKKEWSMISDALKGFSDSHSTPISPSQVCASLYWMARSGNSICMQDRALCSVFKNLLRQSNDWSPLDMGWLLYFIRSRSNRENSMWTQVLKQVAYRFNERLHQMSPKNISCLLHEFGRMDLLPAQAIHRALRVVDERKESMSMKSICLLLSALSRLKVYRSDFLMNFAPHVIQHINSPAKSSLRQVVTAVHNYAKLDTFHRGLCLASVERFGRESRDRITDTDLAMMSHALGRLGIASTEPFWTYITSIFLERVTVLSPLNMAVVISALGKVGVCDPLLMTRAKDHIQRHHRGYSGGQIVNILNAYSTLGLNTDWIDLPADGSKEAVFQLNRIGGEGDMMDPIQRSNVKVEDFLVLNGYPDVQLNAKIGGIWADAVFTNNEEMHAVVSVGDSDVCKMDAKRVLGPTLWRKRYLESQGYRVHIIHRNSTKSLEGMWRELASLVQVDAPQSDRYRRHRPFHVDRETGKVSFS